MRDNTKPEIGTKLIFHFKGMDYECSVATHCGCDYFFVKFSGRKPSDDFPKLSKSDGWHLSQRGYGESWEFLEVQQ